MSMITALQNIYWEMYTGYEVLDRYVHGLAYYLWEMYTGYEVVGGHDDQRHGI